MGRERGNWGQAGRVHIQKGIVDNPTRVGVGLAAKKMRMEGFTCHKVAGEGTGLEGGREGVGIEKGGWGGLHLSVEEEGLKRQVVEDEADDDGVPENSGGARKGVEEVAGKVGLTFLA